MSWSQSVGACPGGSCDIGGYRGYPGAYSPYAGGDAYVGQGAVPGPGPIVMQNQPYDTTSLLWLGGGLALGGGLGWLIGHSLIAALLGAGAGVAVAPYVENAVSAP